MRTVDEHLAEVLAHAHPLEMLDVSLLDSRGCLLAEPVTAPWPLPPFDAAGADGYAVIVADVASASAATPVVLPVTDVVPAGYRASHAIAQGTAIKIGSGAPMPKGAQAVVPLEATDGGTAQVAVHQAVPAGAGIRRAGEDLHKDQTVLPAGGLVGAREMYNSLGVPMPGMVEAMRTMKDAAISLLSAEQAALAGPYFDYLIQGMQTST